jgi:hypothetical protein
VVSVQFWSVPASQYKTGPKPCAAAGRAKAAKTPDIINIARNVFVLVFITSYIPILDRGLNKGVVYRVGSPPLILDGLYQGSCQEGQSFASRSGITNQRRSVTIGEYSARR